MPNAFAVHHSTPRRRRQRAPDTRESPTARGYGRDWQKFRDWYLAQPEHALCRACLTAGRTERATCIDHIVPLREYKGAKTDEENLQPLCHACHSRKTVAQDGGFTGLG